jgi:hypothetical protein
MPELHDGGDGAAAEGSAQSREGQRGGAPVPRKSEVQYLSRIGRRIIICMLLIAALAVIWNLLGAERRFRTQEAVN